MKYLNVIDPTALQSELDTVHENIRIAEEEERIGYMSWRDVNIRRSIYSMPHKERERRRESMLDYYKRKREMEKHSLPEL